MGCVLSCLGETLWLLCVIGKKVYVKKMLEREHVCTIEEIDDVMLD